jgi:hypothetical protein
MTCAGQPIGVLLDHRPAEPRDHATLRCRCGEPGALAPGRIRALTAVGHYAVEAHAIQRVPQIKPRANRRIAAGSGADVLRQVRAVLRFD